MPGYCAQLEAPLLNRQFGFSEAASRVENQLERVLNAFVSQRAEALIFNILDLWDESSLSDDETVRRTANAAIRVALQLPRSLPDPEVSLDPDGEVSFDWTGHGNGRFSVSVNGERRLAFAGRFSETSKLHGMEQFTEVLPPEIIRGIQRTIEHRR